MELFPNYIMDNWIYRGGKPEQRNSLGHEGHRGGVKDTHRVDGTATATAGCRGYSSAC